MCVVCIDFSHLLFNRSHTVCGLVVLLSAVGDMKLWSLSASDAHVCGVKCTYIASSNYRSGSFLRNVVVYDPGKSRNASKLEPSTALAYLRIYLSLY